MKRRVDFFSTFRRRSGSKKICWQSWGFVPIGGERVFEIQTILTKFKFAVLLEKSGPLFRLCETKRSFLRCLGKSAFTYAMYEHTIPFFDCLGHQQLKIKHIMGYGSLML